MIEFLGIVFVAIIGGFIWLCVRDVKATKAAVTHLTGIRGFTVDRTFHCVPGNLLFDFSGRQIGLANVSFPTHSSQNPPSMTASVVIPFQDIIKTSAQVMSGRTMIHLHFALAKKNMINGDDYINLHIGMHDQSDVEELNRALKEAGLLSESAQIA